MSMKDGIPTGEVVECLASGLWSVEGDIYPIYKKNGSEYVYIGPNNQWSNVDLERFKRVVKNEKTPEDWL